eukprot:gene23600-9813_t
MGRRRGVLNELMESLVGLVWIFVIFGIALYFYFKNKKDRDARERQR